MTLRNGHQRPPLILLAAGGTGGHMFPAQALARELLSRNLRVALVTDSRGGGFGPELPQVETFHVPAGQLTAGDFMVKLRGLFRLALGYLECRRLLRRLQPQAVVGFGGYASVPAVLAAAHLGFRTLLHEQNQVVGRANRLLARRASAIAVSFESVAGLGAAEQEKVVVTGNPVRANIIAVGRQPYGVPGASDPLCLLITGGSQGARAFNELVPRAVSLLPEALRHRLTVVQQVRGDDFEEVQTLYADTGVTTELKSFFEDMPARLRAAHLVICRAGASTVAELAAAGRPAILVPYPFASDNHQLGNARAFAEAGGGWVMQQNELTVDALADKLRALLEDPSTLVRAAGAARSFAKLNAAGHLADLVCTGRSGDGGRRSVSGQEAAE